MASFLQICFVFLAFSFPPVQPRLDSPGWLEESVNLRTAKEATQESIIQLSLPTEFDPTRVTQLSWHPRAFLYRGFLSNEECDHLIYLAHDKLEKSMVVDNDSGKRFISQLRTSSGMFLNKAQDEIVARIEDRIAAWTFLPKENGEAIQILHYEHGQKYEPHYDYFHDEINKMLGGHRVATVLMYLSSVIMGGETVFPNSEAKGVQPKDNTWSNCAKIGNAVKPKKGDALLFFSVHPDATTDDDSLHGSCPVIEGEKWSATKWIHARSFKFPRKRRSSSGEECTDEDEYLCFMGSHGGMREESCIHGGCPRLLRLV